VNVSRLIVAAAIAALLGPASAQAATRCPAATGRSATVMVVPQDYLQEYKRFGKRYGTPWQLLAAVGMTESGHGSDRAALRPHDRGVLGPMQFQAGSNAKAVREDDAGNQGFGGTWGEWRTSSGNAPYRMDDPEDQIAAAAAKLRRDAGSARDWRRALYRYNALTSYVDLVLARARGYGLNGCGPSVPPPVATPAVDAGVDWSDGSDYGEADYDEWDAGWETSVAPSGTGDAAVLLAHPSVTLSASARADLAAGVIDARLVTTLLWIADRASIGITTLKTGHNKFVHGSTTKISNHWGGRGADIFVIDGSAVNSSSGSARALWKQIVALPVGQRPTEVGAPWLASGWPRSFFHADHLHVGFDA